MKQKSFLIQQKNNMNYLICATLLIFLLNSILIGVYATCTVERFGNIVYALCNGTYTIVNATVACNTNGYYLAGISSINNETIWKTLSSKIR
jgi:hypothetical protein